jgi:predicted DNA-binding transcriptional regulator AlpA
MDDYSLLRLNPDEAILSESAVAKLLDVDRSTLQSWRQHKTGPPYCKMTRNHVVYLRTYLVQWLASCVVVPGQAPAGGEDNADGGGDKE